MSFCYYIFDSKSNLFFQFVSFEAPQKNKPISPFLSFVMSFGTKGRQERRGSRDSGMATAADRNCTFLISTEKSSSVQQDEICKDIEANDVQSKIRYPDPTLIFLHVSLNSGA